MVRPAAAWGIKNPPNVFPKASTVLIPRSLKFAMSAINPGQNALPSSTPGLNPQTYLTWIRCGKVNAENVEFA